MWVKLKQKRILLTDNEVDRVREARGYIEKASKLLDTVAEDIKKQSDGEVVTVPLDVMVLNLIRDMCTCDKLMATDESESATGYEWI